MNIITSFKIRAALRRSRENHNEALEAAREIRAQRRKAHAALIRARARRIYAAWLDPKNPGWKRGREIKPANVISNRTAAPDDIQFPRIGQVLGNLTLIQKGGAA